MTDESDYCSSSSFECDKSRIDQDVTYVRHILEKQLSSRWSGWNEFNQRFCVECVNATTVSVSDVKPLTRGDLHAFANCLLSEPWRYIEHSSDVFHIPQTIIDLMQRVASHSEESASERRPNTVAGCEELQFQLSTIQMLLQIKEYVFEFPRSFVAMAAEIGGLKDGTQYVVQGLEDNEKWKNLIGQQYQSKEIGLHQFVNDIECKRYKLIVIDDFSERTPVLKMFSHTDDPQCFHKGIPALKSVEDNGYSVKESSHWEGNWGGLNAFNDNFQNAWASRNSETSWVQIKLPRKRVFNAVELARRGDYETALGQSPHEFRIEGSLDGKSDNWIVLTSERVDSWPFRETRRFSFANERAFLYYRIIITRNHGGSDCHSLSIFNLGNIFLQHTGALIDDQH